MRGLPRSSLAATTRTIPPLGTQGRRRTAAAPARRTQGTNCRRPPRSPHPPGLSWAASHGGLRPGTEPPPLSGVAHYGRGPGWRSQKLG
eukprot:11169042-Lingulodinium_polyedra.AAC.1